jgi:hypothetical protein
MRTLRRAFLTVALLAGLAGSAGAQPSSTLTDYVLFAEELLKPNALLVPCGSIGVNSTAGLLRQTNGITLTTGDCVANTARMDGLGSIGGDLFANFTVNPQKPPLAFTPPVLTGSLATNCGFPGSFPVCDLFTPVTVDAGTTLSLPPGTYGHLTVKGGYDVFLLPNPGILQLQGGSYTFCNVKLSRFAEVRALAPVTVNVDGKLKMTAENFFGPDTGNVASDVVVHVNGTKVRYSRTSSVIARVCAPQATCALLDGGTHFGGVWCRKLKARDVTITCASPSGAFVD